MTIRRINPSEYFPLRSAHRRIAAAVRDDLDDLDRIIRELEDLQLVTTLALDRIREMPGDLEPSGLVLDLQSDRVILERSVFVLHEVNKHLSILTKDLDQNTGSYRSKRAVDKEIKKIRISRIQKILDRI